MGVDWKAADATDRLFGALIAAHPGLKLDYTGMAAMYGRGASYDAVEGRFRKYRKIADQLKSEAAANGVTVAPRGRNTVSGASTPRTPRGPRGPKNGITKPSPSTGGKQTKLDAKVLTTPSKKNGPNKRGQSVLDAISLEDGDDDVMNVKTPVKVKTETTESVSSATEYESMEAGLVLSSIENVKEDKQLSQAADSLMDIKQERVNSQTNGYMETTAPFPNVDIVSIGGSFMESLYMDDDQDGYADMEDLYNAEA